jgi:hypothetical protein
MAESVFCGVWNEEPWPWLEVKGYCVEKGEGVLVVSRDGDDGECIV